ncbi:anti-sigma regulatory factor [Methylotetracoccus oryzae]|uniref:anti-sigma regulatory factor n=1 Tax=Methylotetracoccus oryzae TaxID=1919059 RepID=UPI001F22E333|nr:anti-sigma regulatory factor [Methylotetracoccus oryzae]
MTRRISVQTQADVIRARLAARDLAIQLGLGPMDQTRIATAVSELGRNALQYGGGGACIIRDESDERAVRIEIEVVDEGPGIADIEKAMRDGYSSNGGLSEGLPGSKRLADAFDLESRTGEGTCVRIGFVRRRWSLR